MESTAVCRPFLAGPENIVPKRESGRDNGPGAPARPGSVGPVTVPVAVCCPAPFLVALRRFGTGRELIQVELNLLNLLNLRNPSDPSILPWAVVCPKIR